VSFTLLGNFKVGIGKRVERRVGEEKTKKGSGLGSPARRPDRFGRRQPRRCLGFTTVHMNSPKTSRS